MPHPPFVNQPYTDFSIPAERDRQQAALESVRRELGRVYASRIAGAECGAGAEFTSWNPSLPSQAVGHHCKGSTEIDRKSVV